MLAGTVSTGKSLLEIELLLQTAGFQCETDDDEILLKSPANLTVRSGFGHEYIAVAGGGGRDTLTNEARLLSDSLKHNKIKHEFELYDRANELYDVIEFIPLGD